MMVKLMKTKLAGKQLTSERRTDRESFTEKWKIIVG